MHVPVVVEQSEPVSMPLTWTFVILCTVLLEWLMLSLFVAVVTGTFERVRQSYHGMTRVCGHVRETMQAKYHSASIDYFRARYLALAAAHACWIAPPCLPGHTGDEACPCAPNAFCALS